MITDNGRFYETKKCPRLAAPDYCIKICIVKISFNTISISIIGPRCNIVHVNVNYTENQLTSIKPILLVGLALGYGLFSKRLVGSGMFGAIFNLIKRIGLP